MVTSQHIGLELNQDNPDPLSVLTDAMKSKKAVFIKTDIKEELQDLCKDFPDIKMMYFAGKAIHDACVIERMKRDEHGK
jgi:3-methyladenine DNA glycosylase AlkC